MTTYITADQHFGHNNIIRYCGRPFSSVGEMNYELIRRWNVIVKPYDTVISVGDFMYKSDRPLTHYTSQLNGNIVFLKGNHDENLSTIKSMVVEYNGIEFFVTHFPENANPAYKINLVGHSHEKWKIKKIPRKEFGKEIDRYYIIDPQATVDEMILVNIGVDCWSFAPVSFEEILKEVEKAHGLL